MKLEYFLEIKAPVTTATTVATTEELGSVPVVSAQSSPPFGDDEKKWGIDNALDDDEKTIFHSKDKKKPFAKFDVAPATVNKVKVLNRADCCGESLCFRIQIKFR